MKKLSYLTKLGILCVVITVVVYTVHFFIFWDAEFIFRYFIAQLAFLPISVLLVTIVINTLLANRARRERLQKQNIVIAAFFSELGVGLMRRLLREDSGDRQEFYQQLQMNNDWAAEDFARARLLAAAQEFHVAANADNLPPLHALLADKSDYILRLLENPVLQEHEDFTHMLWAVFHFSDELRLRPDLTRLPKADYSHISRDANRALAALTGQWISYMEYLKDSYPYLYHISLRTNPFDEKAQIEVTE